MASAARIAPIDTERSIGCSKESGAIEVNNRNIGKTPTCLIGDQIVPNQNFGGTRIVFTFANGVTYAATSARLRS